MYRVNHRVRYSEISENGMVSISKIIDYFQDCSTFQSEDVGLGLKYLYDKERAWLLSSWQIIINRYPAFGEKLSIGTWPYDSKSIYGYRNFDIIDENGDRIVEANSIWFYVDTASMKPVKIADEDILPYGLENKLDMDYSPRKIILPDNFKNLDEIKVMKYHIDTNAHVNNAKYVEIAESLLSPEFNVYQMRVDYKKAAFLNDILYPKIAINNEICTIRLCDFEDNNYVVVEFMAK